MIPADFRNSYSSLRPTSELLRSRRSIYSEHSEQLNSWYDDLQRYEKCLEEMASVTLDQNFKEELQHVDQWFCYLSDAERTATIYTLLQHSSPIQTRFFMNILQQQKRDSILTVSDQETSSFYQAEKEASQRLMNVIPYKTGGHSNLVSPPPSSLTPQPRSKTGTTTTAYNRHSIAFGDMEDNQQRLFPSPSNSTGLYGNGPTPTHSSTLISPRTYAYPRSVRSRPSSGIDIDSSPDFFSSWRSSVVGGSRSTSADPVFGEGDTTKSAIKGEAFQPWGAPSFNDVHSSALDKPLPRIGTVKENDEEINRAGFGTTTLLSPAFTQYYSTPSPSSSSTTFTPALSHHQTVSTDKTFGAYLDPKLAYGDDNDYYSDQSDDRKHNKNHLKQQHQQQLNKDKKTDDTSAIDMELLKDIPGWFRSLRLHKYNAIFEPMRWQDIIQLSDQELQDKGVAALGARRKMTKVFQTIKDHCKTKDIPY
ncbi:hypothetical protein BC941DRAFT_414193 [Chlamydoabsidia padenii]|nr:hypothetical protein BC941DRAFT_414193 [Chlamydoabsidia padenii]